MADSKATIAEKRAQAVALLATGVPVMKVAESVGVSRVTLWEWCKSQEFKSALEAVRAARVAEIEAEISEIAGSALATMRELAQVADKDSVRFSAAKYLLDRMLGAPTQTVATKPVDAAALAWWTGSDEEEGE